MSVVERAGHDAMDRQGADAQRPVLLGRSDYPRDGGLVIDCVQIDAQ